MLDEKAEKVRIGGEKPLGSEFDLVMNVTYVEPSKDIVAIDFSQKQVA